MKRILALIICIFICSVNCFSQKRKTIDRTKSETVHSTKKTQPKVSSSSEKGNTNKPKVVATTPKQSNKQPARSTSKSHYFSISSQYVSFGSDGGNRTFTVSSSAAWKISVNTANWGHLSRSGNTLYLRVDANNSSSSRTDYFTISSGSKSIRVDISQGKGNSLTVSSESLSFPSAGGSRTITVNSSSSWRIGTKTYDWGHLSTNGNTITLRVDANTTTSSRTDYFTVKAGNLEKRINISQSGGTASSSKDATIKSVSVSNNADVDGEKGLSVNVSFNISGMKGHSGKVSCYFYDTSGNALIDTNDSYGTTGNPSCVAVSRSINPGYDNTVYTDFDVKIPYKELHLSSTYSRTLRVDVIIWDYSSGGGHELTRKSGTTFTCVPNISYLKVDGSTTDKSKYFGESGGREYYSVNTSASSYETWGVPSWCRIENKTSSGFSLVCERNNSRSSRNDYMKVKAAGKEIRIDIEQAASSGPTASITSIEQVHNIMNGFVKGMNIKLKFDVSGMQGRTVRATAWFYYADNSTKLNNAYGNQVSVSKSDTAPYENTTFTMTLFMPYQGLNMAYGWSGSLTFDIAIYDSSGNKLTRQDNNSFTFSNF
jgi:hypothetical protein